MPPLSAGAGVPCKACRRRVCHQSGTWSSAPGPRRQTKSSEGALPPQTPPAKGRPLCNPVVEKHCEAMFFGNRGSDVCGGRCPSQAAFRPGGVWGGASHNYQGLSAFWTAIADAGGRGHGRCDVASRGRRFVRRRCPSCRRGLERQSLPKSRRQYVLHFAARRFSADRVSFRYFQLDLDEVVIYKRWFAPQNVERR